MPSQVAQAVPELPTFSAISAGILQTFFLIHMHRQLCPLLQKYLLSLSVSQDSIQAVHVSASVNGLFVFINYPLVQGATLPPLSDSWGGTPLTLTEGEAGIEDGRMEIRGKQLGETTLQPKKENNNLLIGTFYGEEHPD